MASTLKRMLIGRPLATDEADHQRISKTIGLAVFSSDAISSTAYATGEVMLVLVGAAGLYNDPNRPKLGVEDTPGLLPAIAILVVVLLAIVANSYRQTIHAYPDGGGAYIVSRENLGELPSLVAGGSLLVDYVLTVAVSIAAGVLAMYSAFPGLKDYRVEICLFFVLLLTVANLRGVKESGTFFAVPTYAYMVAMAMFIVWGLVSKATGNLHPMKVDLEALAEVRENFKVSDTFVPVSAYIFARAFSSGAVALSGVEAISNGIPAFRKPTSKNAATTLVWMSLILGSGFLGISMIATWMKPTPSEHESLISIMGEQLMGRGAPYYFLQFATMAILILAAAAFHSSGQTEVAEIQDAYRLLSPTLGVAAASTLFALALLASGQNSTITATLAGQIVMEGFLRLRFAPWLRRAVTRLLAIVPVLVVTSIYGESGTAQLLVLSQVVLSLQLPFAVVPLVRFTSDRTKMGELVAPRWMAALAWIVAAIIISLNMKLLYDFATGA